jgi:hypothetical protein
MVAPAISRSGKGHPDAIAAVWSSWFKSRDLLGQE